MDEEKKIPTKRDLNYQQLLALKAEWPEIIFAIGTKDNTDYVTIAINFHGFAQICYRYGDWHYTGFYVHFTDEYVKELDNKFFKTADEAFSALLVWKEKKGYKFKRYEEPKVINNQFE